MPHLRLLRLYEGKARSDTKYKSEYEQVVKLMRRYFDIRG